MRQIFALVVFSIGVFAPNFFATVPSSNLAFIAAIACAIGFMCISYYVQHSCCILVASFSIGLSYGLYSAQQFGKSILPPELNNQKVLMTGHVEGIPVRNGRIWKLDFIPETLDLLSHSEPASGLEGYAPDKVRLSYYGNPDQGFVPDFVPGERLIIEAKLKQPKGLMNEGLFDYQRWLIGQGYSATGYIKKLIKRTDPQGYVSAIDRWRAELSRQINKSGVPNSGVQTALLNGDRSGIATERMSLFSETGTLHLMVISGLHIGFIAGIGFFISRWIISLLAYVKGPPLGHINAIRCACLGAVISAFLYALAAGFSTSTIRAVFMLCAVMLPGFFYLKSNHWWGLSLALAVVAVIDPLAPLQNGFWLSFGAVTLIFISLNNDSRFQLKPRPQFPAQPDSGTNSSAEKSGRNPLWSLMRIQMVFLLGFAPMILMVQGELNLVSFLANMIAVPLTGLIIVPLEVIGLALFQMKENYGIWLWEIAGRVIGFEIWYLELLQQKFQWVLVRNSIPVYLEIIAVLAGLSFFGLGRAKYRVLAILCLLPAFTPGRFFSSDNFSLEVRVFDVGQGLSILVRQPGYNLVYDTGPRFSESFDSGRDILAPSLAQLGISEISDLVISHPDADHMGGYKGLSREIPIRNIWVGRQSESEPIHSAKNCIKGKTWSIGHVHYEFLYPLKPDELSQSSIYQSSNDRSCVLKVSFAQHVVLLPGDIGTSVENLLITQPSFTDEQLSLLIAPHHGSKTSSGLSFLKETSPQKVVFSAGALNRFGHPHSDVVARYEKLGSQIYSTAENGMLVFKWLSPDARQLVQTEAEKRIFWWQK